MYLDELVNILFLKKKNINFLINFIKKNRETMKEEAIMNL